MRHLTSWMLLGLFVAALAYCAPGMAEPLSREALARLFAENSALRGRSFSGASAAGMDLVELDLQNTGWQKADLRGTRFVRCNLQGADLSGASARGALLVASNLADAVMSHADLSGAILRGVNLAGATLSDCRLEGTRFEDVRLSSNGGTHVAALTLALRKATAIEYGRAWVNGLSGDAFCFIYNTEFPPSWPCAPYYQHPVMAAGQLAGVEVELHVDLSPAESYERLAKAVRAGDVCMIPVQLTSPQLWDDEQRGIWALVDAIGSVAGAEGADLVDLIVPPFGTRQWNEQELMSKWVGPWPTLQPVGQGESTARYAMLVIKPTDETTDPGLQVVLALQAAARMIRDERTHGPLLPGAQGLAKLAGELHGAGTEQDMERMRELAGWSLHARQCLAGSRTEAYRFCTAAMQYCKEPNRSVVSQMAAMYETEAKLLGEMFPTLAATESERPDAAELAERFVAAAQVVQQVQALELRIANLIERLE